MLEIEIPNSEKLYFKRNKLVVGSSPTIDELVLPT
jgi:hypothetical protein